MRNFRKILHNSPIGLKHTFSNKIVSMFEEISKDYIYQKREARKLNSNIIKYNLVKLGHELGYRVYANGLTEIQLQEQNEKYKFVCREFLYDVHWYKDIEGKFYTPENISLVAESELGDTRKGDQSKLRNPAIKFDFQKLLVANAELRLMVFKVSKFAHLEELNVYFEEAIQAYTLLNIDSIFLFICFVHDTKEFYYTEKYKS